MSACTRTFDSGFRPVFSFHTFNSYLEALEMAQEDFMPVSISVDIQRAEESDIEEMLGIFSDSYRLENPRLAQLMYKEDLSVEALYFEVEDILETHLNSQDCRIMVAYDNAEGECEHSRAEAANSLYSEIDINNLIFGWISVGIVPSGDTGYAYAASELLTYACSRLLAEEALARGENELDTTDPRFRLLCRLKDRSKDGRARYIINQSYLIVNALVFGPEDHEDTHWEMALKLLGWAVSFAEGRNLPIWTQITVNQKPFFRQAGFREVEKFTLNLNDYAPLGSTDDWGMQEWVQMVYRAPGERRTRSVSPRDGGGRRRRLSS
ncbi:MAG: hypothetical protein ALECFALPRED_007149 [Alectoria fallacina]|uniref:N-acetyltransferase domain-containing protein n=1 Tax=Alectoria fallacina TaxID=1903189 RepID=A0A8H3J072_9LECA|nr:MAG: hypothetical protein ALECFALPRED_007149 [Alectoria fallacina]